MDGDRLLTGEAVALDLPPASVLLRACSTAIDVLMGWLLLIGALTGLIWMGALNTELGQSALIVLFVLFFVALPTAVETFSRGRSLGKLALGLRVVRDDGGAIGLRHAFVRSLMGVLDLYLTVGGLAVLVALANPMSKRLGDLLAGTHAQVERVPKSVPVVVAMPPELVGWAGMADVGRLPDGVARRVAGFFRESRAMMPESRLRRATDLVAEVTPFVSPVPAVHPEVLLAAVVAIRRNRDFSALTLEQERLARLDSVFDARPSGFPRQPAAASASRP